MSFSFLRWPARASRVLAAAAVVLAVLPSGASRADNAAQSLPFVQRWTNTALIGANDDWSQVPGIVGHRGDDITTATGADPQLLLADGTNTPFDVNIGQSPSFGTGGIAEFEGLTDPTVAMQGSGTADAPFLLVSISTVGRSAINVAYNIRDVDTTDNTNQQVALHYRIGASGLFTNVPGAYVADATAAGATALVTPVSVVLPPDANNQPLVQIRIMTTNAGGTDEWVGIDDITITGSAVANTNPSGAGSASPTTVFPGQASLLTVAVTPGAEPASTGIQVSADLSSIGGSATQAFANNGGNSFSFSATVAMGTTIGAKSLPVTITDGEGRSGSTNITLQVDPPPPPLGHPVISQVYGGGGNSGATYTNDFVELYNPGTSPVDVTGWSIQYASAAGSFSASLTQPLAGVIGPGEYYLVALASGGSSGADLPMPNVSNADINMSATNGKVALVSNGDPATSPTAPTCPLTDPDLIDFVGYGTANCKEGSATAPAASNTTAIFRKNGGSTDTDQNGADFLTDTPDPRRTAPIAEVGPRVQNTDPPRNGTNAPRDSSVTVTFSEPVDVTEAWLHVVCSTTGAHDDATLAGGPTTYVFTPNLNFVPTETCTATITRDAVHDQDLDDASPDTDTLPADYVWTFTVATGTAPPYSPDVHLAMGNPSGATPELTNPNNYLMEKPEFALSYSRDRGTPNWVSWHLEDVWTGSLVRNDTFRPDPAVPADWYRVQATDFFSSGFDRGHMTPNADRDFEHSIPINQATFLMTNMIPQAPDNNQGPWANLENYLRTLLLANEIYIVSGPAGVGGTGSNGGTTTTLAGGHVTVPASTWKVALVLPKAEGDDVTRVSASARTIAVIMPNTQGIRTTNPNDWEAYLTTVDAVEALTHYDFFANVEDGVESSIEAGINGVNPPVAVDQSITLEEDSSLSFRLNAIGMNPSSLTYTLLNGPSHGTARGVDGDRTYVPFPEFWGTDSFTYKVCDGDIPGGGLVPNCATGTVTVDVSPVNDPPVFTFVPGAATTPELAPYTFTAEASDVDGPSLTFALVGAPAGATIHPTTGQFAWMPTEAQGGTGVPFVFKVSITDGTSNTDADIAITVTEINQAPTLNVATSHTVSLGETLTFVAVGGDADIPALVLSYGLAGAVPAGASINPATGVFTWTPTAAQAGSTYAFNVTVTDGISPTSVAIAVTVIGPRGIAQDVLARVKALRNTVHDRSDRKSLDDVIEDLTEAVQARYWLDASHLEPRRGDRVFDETEQAVRELAKLKRECHSRIPDAALQGFIDDLVRATRLIAETALADAIAAHGDGRDIAQARADLADGNRDAARGRSDDAIRSYESAWERALKAVR
jgi:DNA/RNA endonuclease G (NUC1)